MRQELLGRERRRLHAACFEVITALAPDDQAALAHHAQGAGRFDEVVAIARIGSKACLDRGASFLALRLASEGLAEDAADPVLLATATQAAWRLDFVSEASEYAQRWVQVAPTTTERIDAMRYASRLHLEMRDQAACDAVRTEFVVLAEELPSGSDLARALAAVAQLLMLGNDDSAADWARRAMAEAIAAGDVVVRVQAETELASSLSQHASSPTALEALRGAAAQARAIGDGVQLSRALNITVDLLPPLSAESATSREELRRLAAEHGLDKLGHRNIMWLDASVASAAGDLATTKRVMEEWATWTPDAGNNSLYQARRASIAVEEGRISDAAGMFAELGEVHDFCTDDVVLVPWLTLAALSRDIPLGRDVFEMVLSHIGHNDSWYSTSHIVRGVTAAPEVGISPSEIRERFLAVRMHGHPSRVRLAAVAEGFLALAEDRPADVVEALTTAVGAADETVTRWVEGTMRMTLAQALLANGDRHAAQDQARLAVEALERWPGWRRNRAEALLSRLVGSAVRAVGVLTARENEVASLIAEGLTNGQLAERLYISPKTAAVHVSNMLAKLGLSSRTEIAAWSIRRELPQAG